MEEQRKSITEFKEIIFKTIEHEINSIKSNGVYQEGIVAGLKKSLDLIQEEYDIYTGTFGDAILKIAIEIKAICDKYLKDNNTINPITDDKKE